MKIQRFRERLPAPQVEESSGETIPRETPVALLEVQEFVTGGMRCVGSERTGGGADALAP